MLDAQENVRWLKIFARLLNLDRSERKVRDIGRRLEMLEKSGTAGNTTRGEEEKND